MPESPGIEQQSCTDFHYFLCPLSTFFPLSSSMLLPGLLDLLMMRILAPLVRLDDPVAQRLHNTTPRSEHSAMRPIKFLTLFIPTTTQSFPLIHFLAGIRLLLAHPNRARIRTSISSNANVMLDSSSVTVTVTQKTRPGRTKSVPCGTESTIKLYRKVAYGKCLPMRGLDRRVSYRKCMKNPCYLLKSLKRMTSYRKYLF